jgi:hypothetical protein
MPAFQDRSDVAAAPKSGGATARRQTPAAKKKSPATAAKITIGARRPEKATFEPPMEYKGQRMVPADGRPIPTVVYPGSEIGFQVISPDMTLKPRDVLRIPAFDADGDFIPRVAALDRPHLEVPVLPLTQDSGVTALPGSLRTMFSSPDGFARATACWIAGEYRDASLVDLLSARLSDPDNRVRRFAAQALGLIGGRKASAALQQFLAGTENMPATFKDSERVLNDWSQKQTTVAAAREALARAGGSTATNVRAPARPETRTMLPAGAGSGDSGHEQTEPIQPNSRDAHGRPALLAAILNNRGPVVRLLLDRGANVNEADGDGFTPLMISANKGDLSLCTELIERGANVNSQSRFGTTPLIFAAQNGYSKIVDLLLAAGAKREILNVYGESAGVLARKLGYADTAKRLGVDIDVP